MTNLNNAYVEFKDRGDIIYIEPLGFSFHDTKIGSDREWVRSKVTIKAGVFSGQYHAEFRTTDFEYLKEQLENLYKDLHGSATFDPLEHQLVLNIKGDGLGHFEV